MALTERLEQLIKLEGSQTEFSRKTGIHKAAISSILKRGSGMNSTNLEQIALAYPTLNLRWLLTGEGELWLGEPPAAGKGKRRATPPPTRDPDLLNEMMLHRVRELERRLKQVDPEGAKELGIE